MVRLCYYIFLTDSTHTRVLTDIVLLFLFKFFCRTALISEEMFLQGDYEKQLGINVSPGIDRENGDIPKSQIGFFTYIINPFFSAIVDLDPRFETIRNAVLTNYKYWKDQSDELNSLSGNTSRRGSKTVSSTRRKSASASIKNDEKPEEKPVEKPDGMMNDDGSASAGESTRETKTMVDVSRVVS